MIALLLLIGGLAVGSLSFFSQMNSNYILVQSGTSPIPQILNNHTYLQSKKGFIFSITFLFVGTCFMIMVALPSEDPKGVKRSERAPQPIEAERKESSISAVIEHPPTPERREDAPPTPIEKDDALITPPVEIIEQIEELSTDFDDVTEGEDDVVYGAGPISDAAIMHFVHKFPDSALKFLFRKQLDGKALTNVEDSIYQEWENRNLTRGKVKGYILTLMDWKEFPKKPLYETWKEVRDHIYENIE